MLTPETADQEATADEAVILAVVIPPGAKQVGAQASVVKVEDAENALEPPLLAEEQIDCTCHS